MVQIIPAADTSSIVNPLLQGINVAAASIANRIEQRRQEELQAQQRAQQAEQLAELLGARPKAEPQGAVGLGSDLQILDDQGDRILLGIQTGAIDPDIGKLVLQQNRSQRNVLAEQLGAGEKEETKLAAKRRDEAISKIIQRADGAEEALISIAELEGLIRGGETGPSIRNAIINATKDKGGLQGAVNGFLTTVESQGFDTAKRKFLPQLKVLFGGRLNQTEVELFMDSLVRFGTDPEAQLFALDIIRNEQNMAIAQKELLFGSSDAEGNFIPGLIDERGVPVPGFDKKLADGKKALFKQAKERVKSARRQDRLNKLADEVDIDELSERLRRRGLIS